MRRRRTPVPPLLTAALLAWAAPAGPAGAQATIGPAPKPGRAAEPGRADKAGPEKAGPEKAARAAELAALFDELKDAPKELVARGIEDRIWRLWLAPPNAAAEARMDWALRRLRVADYEAALTALDALVGAEPGWAEAWNQRAHVLFLMGRDDRALQDADRALALEPRHFGALSGKALIFARQGREALMLAALREAVALNPFLKERWMLRRAAPKGQPI